MVTFQDTFDDLSQALREEENFNPLKFTEKIKDVRNTKRADMTGKMMTPNQMTNMYAMIPVGGAFQKEHLFRLERQI